MQGSLRLKKCLASGVLILGSVVLMLIAAEGAARSLGYKPHPVVTDLHSGSGWTPDPELGWVRRAGSYPSSEPGHALMSFREDGSREDPAGGKAKAPRIITVGCSFTEGTGVVDSETYAHVLNRSFPDYDIINHGAAGYGAYQSLLRLRRYFRSAGDKQITPMAVYGLIGDHLRRNVASARTVAWLSLGDGRRFVPPNIRMAHGRLTAGPWGPIDPWPLETESALVGLAHLAAINVKHWVSTSEQEEVQKEIVRRMAEEAHGHGAGFVVVGLADVPRWFEDWARNNSIDFVDCQHPNFRRDPTLKVGGIGHPSGTLHEWWGTCLSKALPARLAVPPSDTANIVAGRP